MAELRALMMRVARIFRRGEEPRVGSEEYCMALAVEVATRVNCMKAQVGAILVFDGRIRAVGYNGTLPGFKDCFAGGCDRCRDENIVGGEEMDRCVCVHAEENALASAARYGIPVDGCDCYVTYEPCVGCTKLLIQAGTRRVVWLQEYIYEKDIALGELRNRNRIRANLLKHQEQRRWRGARGTRFEDFKPRTTASELLAAEWRRRLREMKNRKKDYCAKLDLLIPKRPEAAT